MKKATMGQRMIGSILLCFFLICSTGYAETLPDSVSSDYLSPYAELYLLPIQPAALENPQTSFTPSTAEIEDIKIEFAQVACDGEWILTCALASSEQVFLLPGGATLDRPACGENFVPEGADDRTFREAAQAAGKEIRSVYVYLEEFDSYGQYFLDHSIQDGKTVLYSGCCLPESSEEPLQLHWTVQIYSVNPDTAKLTFMRSETFPVTVVPTVQAPD